MTLFQSPKMSSYIFLLYLSSYTNSRSQIFHPNCTPKLSCGHIRHAHFAGICAALKGVKSSCFPPLGTRIPSAVTWDCGEPTDEAPVAQGRRGSQGPRQVKAGAAAAGCSQGRRRSARYQGRALRLEAGAGGSALSARPPRSRDLRRKELPHQFREAAESKLHSALFLF